MRTYSLKTLTRMFLDEHPDWNTGQARERAVRLRKELHRFDEAWRRSTKRFRVATLLLGSSIGDPGHFPEAHELEVVFDV